MGPKLDEQDDWQMDFGQIRERCAYLLVTEKWADCSFLVEKQVIKAHKLILAMASPVFETMFYGSLAETGDHIDIQDIRLDTFRKLLEYIYTDNIELDSFNSAFELYYAAKKYMLPHLVSVCTMYLSCNLEPQQALQTYQFANLVGEDQLMEESLMMIQTATKSVLTDDSFYELQPDMVVKLFSMEPLNIESELDLFDAAERYARALDNSSEPVAGPSTEPSCSKYTTQEQKTTELAGDVEINDPEENVVEDTPADKSVTAATNTQAADITENDEGCTNGKKIMRKALEHIRFLTLSARQLAEHRTLTSLLTETEILALFMNIASRDTHMPMQEGFSTSRTCRPHK